MTFNWLSFVIRLSISMLVVLLTVNPSGYSYYHWLLFAIQNSSFGPQHAFVGVLLLIGWTIPIRATYRSLGWFGLLLTSALIGTFVWMLDEYQLISTGSTTAVGWVALLSLAVLLAIGMSWSHIRRRLSGQIDVDDVDDD